MFDPLVETLGQQGLVVKLHFVDKELRAGQYLGQVSHPEHTVGAHTLTMAQALSQP